MAMINVCAKCMCDVLRWENEKWTCFECGHASDGLKTIVMPDDTSSERGFMVKNYPPAPHLYGSPMYIPTNYELMNNFAQFVAKVEETRWKN